MKVLKNELKTTNILKHNFLSIGIYLFIHPFILRGVQPLPGVNQKENNYHVGNFFLKFETSWRKLYIILVWNSREVIASGAVIFSQLWPREQRTDCVFDLFEVGFPILSLITLQVLSEHVLNKERMKIGPVPVSGPVTSLSLYTWPCPLGGKLHLSPHTDVFEFFPLPLGTIRSTFIRYSLLMYR